MRQPTNSTPAQEMHNVPALFRALSAQGTGDMYWLIDLDGRILAAAGDCEQVIGRSAVSLRGSSVSELSAIDSSARVRGWLATVEASGFDRRETRLRTLDDGFVDVEITLQRPVDAADRLVCSVHDIAERRRQELSIRAEADGYRAVFDHSLDAMLSLDDDHRIVDLNDAARTMLFAQAIDVRGMPFEEMLDDETGRALVANWSRIIELGAERGTARLRARDEFSRIVDFSIRAQYTIGHHLIVLRDISAQQELEAQLRQSQKLEAVGRLAGGVAHDFNSLMTAVLVSAEALLADTTPGDPHANDLHVIRDAAGRASTLTRQLLSFGQRRWSAPRTYDLRRIVKDSMLMLHRLIGPYINIECELGDGPYQVRADEGQLEQVLLNLALNARDAMPGGGTLHIDAGPFDPRINAAPLGVRLDDAAYYRLVVRDNGTGMNDEIRSRIFEPFFTTKAGKGTGLGLPTVYGIVQQCGGAVHVQSEVTRGSTFSVFLPKALNPTPPAGMDALPSHAATRVGRILLVDDDPSVRVALARVLTRFGHDVVAAANAEEAIVTVEQSSEPFDVLVTDLTMPGMRGDALARLLVSRQPALRVVIITGDAARDVQLGGTAGQQAELLRKPFTTSDLEHYVQRALDNR